MRWAPRSKKALTDSMGVMASATSQRYCPWRSGALLGLGLRRLGLRREGEAAAVDRRGVADGAERVADALGEEHGPPGGQAERAAPAGHARLGRRHQAAGIGIRHPFLGHRERV